MDRFVRNRVAEGVGSALDELLPRLDQADRVVAENERVAQHHRDEHWARIEDLAAQVQTLRGDVERLQFEHQRLVPAVAGLEVRTERLRRAAEDRPVGTGPEESAEARDLIAEVRREHERIRARMSAVASYEERLRRLEMSGADARTDAS
jgi:prefoldin subunit 5